MNDTPLYFEDYQAGSVRELGSLVVDEAEVIAFAKRYDPQPFHTDPEAARHSAFGGLIASGWHTTAMVMRLLVDHYLSPTTSLGSPGVDELRWLRPVRPGDVLSVRATVLETKRSSTKPDRGLIRTQLEAINQQGEVVMSLTPMSFVRCRPAQ